MSRKVKGLLMFMFETLNPDVPKRLSIISKPKPITYPSSVNCNAFDYIALHCYKVLGRA